MKPILSLIIMTYNREKFLSALLNFLNQELLDFPVNIRNEFELVISDNASIDSTQEIINSFIEQNKNNYKIRYNRNSENVGLTGNFRVSTSIAEGKYIWWLGDDDYYKKGILRVVLQACKKDPAKIFLNHSAFYKNPGDNLNFDSILHDIDLDNIVDAPIQLLEKHLGVSMFQSANIFKREYINEILRSNVKINLAFPLYCSIYCMSKGTCKIISDIYVDDNCSNISWRPQWRQVFLFDMPYYVSLMPRLGFSKQQFKRIWKANYSDLQYRRFRTFLGLILRKLHMRK